MRIGIDARLYYETGVGRYIQNLIRGLSEIDSVNHYSVFLTPEGFRNASLPKNWDKREVTIPWHSIAEQTAFIPILLRQNCDVVHFPYFSFPMLYPKPFVVTVHDLIVHHFATGRASTQPVPVYTLKRLGYYTNLSVGLKRAAKIISVSQSTKKELITHINLPGEKINVIYEGVDTNFLQNKRVKKSPVSQPFFLYVGNAYPHKNVETLIYAFEKFCHENPSDSTLLVLVGRRDYFYQKLEQLVAKLSVAPRILFLGEVDDRTLYTLYKDAQAFIFPSRMEGFGLSILEALSVKCPVIASDIPVFRELFKEYVEYFNPDNSDQLAQVLKKALNQPKNWHERAVRAQKYTQNFSWEKAAEQTLKIYEMV